MDLIRVDVQFITDTLNGNNIDDVLYKYFSQRSYKSYTLSVADKFLPSNSSVNILVLDDESIFYKDFVCREIDTNN